MVVNRLRRGYTWVWQTVGRHLKLSPPSSCDVGGYVGSTQGHEVRYWLQTGLRKGTYIYDNYLRLFGLDKDELTGLTICDFGCGPLGGIPSVLPDVKVAYPLDVLADEYNKWGACRFHIYPVRDYRTPLPDHICDVCFCTNALDHVPEPVRVATEIARLLKPGGSLYLHVHLRRSDQLNKAHRYVVSEDMVRDWLHEYFTFESVGVDWDWPNDEPDLTMLYAHLVRCPVAEPVAEEDAAGHESRLDVLGPTD